MFYMRRIPQLENFEHLELVYTNFTINPMTKAKMANASVKAIPTNIIGVIFPAASGFRPIASSALETMSPMPIPGPSTPNPTASAIPNAFADSNSISYVLFNNADNYSQRMLYLYHILHTKYQILTLVGFRNRDFYKEESQKRENRSLYESDENLKNHERHRKEIRNKVTDYEN